MKQRQTSNAHEPVWNFNFCHLTLILPVWSQKYRVIKESRSERWKKERKKEYMYIFSEDLQIYTALYNRYITKWFVEKEICKILIQILKF